MSAHVIQNVDNPLLRSIPRCTLEDLACGRMFRACDYIDDNARLCIHHLQPECKKDPNHMPTWVTVSTEVADHLRAELFGKEIPKHNKLNSMNLTLKVPKIDQPHFCTTCGRQLIRMKLQKAFDHDTGEPEYEYKWRCPNKKWWNLHMSFTTDANFDSYSYHDY